MKSTDPLWCNICKFPGTDKCPYDVQMTNEDGCDFTARFKRSGEFQKVAGLCGLSCHSENLKSLREIYEKFDHLDKCLSDTEWCEAGESSAIYGIAGEMWRAIKKSLRQSTAQEEQHPCPHTQAPETIEQKEDRDLNIRIAGFDEGYAQGKAEAARTATLTAYDKFMEAIEFRFDDTNNGRGVIGVIREIKNTLRQSTTAAQEDTR